MTDLDAALQAMRKAEPKYRKAEQYSDGPIEHVFVPPKMRRIMAETGVDFQELLGDTVIDAVADGLDITAILGGDDATNAVIATLDTANAMTLVRPQVNRLTLKYGDYLLKAWVRDDGSLQVVMVDPRQARLFYDPEDPMTPTDGVHRWITADGHVRVDMLYSDRVESFISAKADRNAKRAADFVPYTVGGNESNVIEHEFGRPPLFHFSTDLPGEYGCPEHATFYATQDLLIKNTLALVTALDFAATPQRWAILENGVDTTEAEDQDDEFARFENEGGAQPRRTSHESVSSLKANAGSVWFQRGIKAFGQFAATDPSVFIEPAEFHLKMGATASRTPLHYFETSGEQPSGESRKVAMEPLISKRRARRDTLDHGWVTFYTSVLRVLGLPNATVELRWAPVEPIDEAEVWANAKAKQDAGVPVDVTLIEAGYDKETVEGWAGDTVGNLDDLVKIGEFLASSATAVAAGAATAEQISAILAKVTGGNAE